MSYNEQLILTKLQNHPWFRERKNRAKGLALLLNRKFNLGVDERKLADAITEAETLARLWRKHTRDYPGLRGRDYEAKKQLVQTRQSQLGYQPDTTYISKQVDEKVALPNT